MKERIGIAAVLFAACSLLGCNNLTGAEGTTLDEDGVNSGGPVEEQALTPAPEAIGCGYPIGGTVGVDVASTLPGTLNWQGIRGGETEGDTINVTEFFDCVGDNYDALLFVTAQYG